MIFKTRQLAEDWALGTLMPDLRILAEIANDLLWKIAGRPLCVTNVFEDAGATTTHSEGRALDCRTTTQGYHEIGDLIVRPWGAAYLMIPQAQAWRERINGAWSTGARFAGGEEMLPAVLHDVGLGHHLHLQVARGRRLERRHHG